jgi:quinol monooxygenase YgiN
MEKELIVKWKIKASHTEAIIKLLPELAEETKKEKGNLLYTVYQSKSDPNELILHERYTDEEALEAHKNSPHYQSVVIGQVIPHLEVREVTFVNKLV